MTTKIDGQLEIDHERGVIYFHSAKSGCTVLRICKLPKPIPKVDDISLGLINCLDVAFATVGGCNWRGDGK